MPRRIRAQFITLLALLGATPGAQAAVVFNFTPQAGTPANVITAFNQAGSFWQTKVFDDVTVNIEIGFPSLGAGILGQAGSNDGTIDFNTFRNALLGDVLSANDATAAGSLPTGSSFNMYLNYTSNNPNGVGSATRYVDNDGDANNSTVRLNLANAKAIGLWPAQDPTLDAVIEFSSNFSWDFDRSNGITPGFYDLVGVAIHEIGHALGFVSGVDILDQNSTGTFYADNLFTYVAPLDLFRYSLASVAAGGAKTIDWTAGTGAKYFSIDGGITNLGPTFSTGSVHGDGRQASHWKDSLGLGIMDPTAAPGELLAFTANDLLAFDVVGWDLTQRLSTSIPEPGTAGLAVLGSLALRMVRKKIRATANSTPAVKAGKRKKRRVVVRRRGTARF